MQAGRTFGKQAIFARFSVLAQEPAIAKVIVAFNELNAVSAPEAQLVGAAGDELVCGGVLAGMKGEAWALQVTYARRQECRRGGSPRCGSVGPWWWWW